MKDDSQKFFEELTSDPPNGIYPTLDEYTEVLNILRQREDQAAKISWQGMSIQNISSLPKIYFYGNSFIATEDNFPPTTTTSAVGEIITN